MMLFSSEPIKTNCSNKCYTNIRVWLFLQLSIVLSNYFRGRFRTIDFFYDIPVFTGRPEQSTYPFRQSMLRCAELRE